MERRFERVSERWEGKCTASKMQRKGKFVRPRRPFSSPSYLIRLGVTRLEDAAGLDPYGLYQELCILDDKQHHPCWMDVFVAVVSYANGEPARPWWEFTPQRKAWERSGRW